MVNHSSMNISSARVLTGAWIVALALFASVSFADPVLYTDDTLPSANIAIGADGVEFQLSAAKTYAYTMSGSGSLYKTGAGTLTLNKNGSTFTGDVNLNGGKIKVTVAWTGTKSALGEVQTGRSIYVNSGTELIFANQNIFNNAHNDNPVALVIDGGKISNEGPYYNFLQYLTLKNGANLHATDGNTTWEAYKLQNLNVVSNSDGSAATAPTITGANNNHAVISFGAKSDEVATKPSTIYVENITNNANSDLIISAKIVDSTTVNTGVRTPGEIIKTGAGTLELKNVNSSYSGNLTIKEGTVKVTAGSNEDNRTASALGASNVAGRTVTVNKGAVLELAAQDVMCDTHADTKLLFVVDGGKITNSGANFNFIQNVTLKNGANMHAANGNTSWEAYKIQNLRVERSGDAAAAAVSLTAASGDHNVFTFGAISSTITTTPVSIYVEDITSANGASDTATDLLISAKIVDANTDGKTKKPAPMVKSGAGTLQLTNTGSTYSGNLTIDEGTVKVTAGSASNSRTASALGASNVAGRLITVNEGAVLEMTVDNVIVNAHTSSKLAIVVDGGQIINWGYNFLQNLTLKDGAQVYAANGMDVWKSYKFHNLNVVRKSADAADSPVTISSDLTKPYATIAFGDISNTIKVGDNNSISTVTVEEITSADPSVNDNVSDLVISAIIADPIHTTTGALTNATQIVKAGAGTMELTAANPITGKTTISEGVIKLTGDGTLGSGEVAVAQNATLEFAHESDQTFTNALSGTGAVTKTGSGTLTLSGADTHTGETTVSAGTLKLTGNALPALVNKTAGVTNVEPDGTLEYNVNSRVAPVRLTFSDDNKISSTGEVIKTGDGTLQLYEAASGAIDIRSLTVSSGRVDISGFMTGGITVEPGSVFSPGPSSSASVTDVPAVVGHRGNSSVAPENTLSAFRSCVESGAQGAECDVYRTKDGYLVLQHDSTLSRNVRDADGNPVSGRIADYTLDELLTMDFGVWKGEEFRGEKVATLDQYLDLLNGTNCAPVIELKQDGLEADTIAAVRERGMEDETTIIAFSEAAIKECRRLAPEIKAAWLCTKNSSETVDQYADRIIAKLQELDTTYVDLESSPVTPELVQKLHDNGITVMTWTVDNPNRVTELYNMGIDSVTTNVPATGIELLDYMIGPGADTSIGQASFGDDFVLKEGATLLLEFDETGADSLLVSGDTEFEEGSLITLALAEGASPVPSQQLSFQLPAGIDTFDLANLSYPYYLAGIGYDPTTGILSAYVDANAIPEPSTWALLVLGAAGMLYWRKRK